MPYSLQSASAVVDSIWDQVPQVALATVDVRCTPTHTFCTRTTALAIEITKLCQQGTWEGHARQLVLGSIYTSTELFMVSDMVRPHSLVFLKLRQLLVGGVRTQMDTLGHMLNRPLGSVLLGNSWSGGWKMLQQWCRMCQMCDS